MAYGGTWNSADPPLRSGFFNNVDTVTQPRVLADAGGVVGVVVTADWGPINQIVEITSEAQASTVYASGGTAYFAISQALKGEGTAGRGGATSVKAYRAAVAGTAAKAAVNLQHSGAVNALTLTAKYQGTRGNSFKATVQASAAPDASTHVDILLYEGTTLRESYIRLAKTDVTAMAAAINASSNLVDATMLVTGTALAVVSNASFTGGNSGTSLTGTEHAAAMAAFESAGGFSVFAVDNLTDGTIMNTYRDWTDRLNSEGKMFHMVVGGAASESASTAITRSSTMDSPWIVNLFGDVKLSGTAYSSAQLCPRVAGIIAASGYQRSITFAQIPEGSMTSPPTSATIETVVRGMAVPFWSDGGIIKLQRGRTTLTAATVTEPVSYKSLLFTRKVQQAIREFDEVGSAVITSGQFVNTANDRDALLGLFRAKIKDLEARNVLTPGTGQVNLDPSFDNSGESIHLIFTLTVAPGIEQVLGRTTISA